MSYFFIVVALFGELLVKILFSEQFEDLEGVGDNVVTLLLDLLLVDDL